jgi:hypothetical protein
MKLVYRVYWDNGASACGTFPQIFDTEEEADAYGEQWAKECNLRDGLNEEDEESYSYDVLTEELLDEEEIEEDQTESLSKAALNRGRP